MFDVNRKMASLALPTPLHRLLPRVTIESSSSEEKVEVARDKAGPAAVTTATAFSEEEDAKSDTCDFSEADSDDS